MKNFIYCGFILSMIYACNSINNSDSQDLILSGKIIVHKFPSATGSCIVYNNNAVYEFMLPNSSKKEYSGIRWLNDRDSLIGIEKIKSRNRKTTHSNLVLLDTLGKVTKDIITTQEGQYISAPYMSPSDSLLFFITEVESENQSGLDLIRRPITINIINFKTKVLIKQLQNVCNTINFDIQESPWSLDESSIVYSIVNDREIREEGKTESINLHSDEGVFVYNLIEDSFKKIADKGRSAVWSPQGEHIAFISNNKIFLHKLTSGKNELLYEAEKKEQLKVIHWTPDGNYLYVICPKYYGNNFNMKHNEKLIEIKGKTEVNFRKLNIGLNNFSWK